MICEEFKERVLQDGHYTHYCELEGQHLWSMIFTSSEGESCAVNGTDEEVAFLFDLGRYLFLCIFKGVKMHNKNHLSWKNVHNFHK